MERREDRVAAHTRNVAYYHDSAACLADGDIVTAAQEERFTLRGYFRRSL